MNEIKFEHIKSSLRTIPNTKKIEYFLLALAGLGACLGVFFAFSGDIWADEAYSLRIIQYGWLDVIKMSAADVHPPLYYLMLKLVVDVFGIISKDYYFTVVVAKFVSLTPCFLLGLLIWKKYKDAGIARALMLLGLFGLFQITAMSVEIRMYSWGLFFVTAQFIYASSILSGDLKNKNWICLGLFSVLAAYTHTFALIAMASVWLYFFVLIIVYRKDLIKECLICSIAVAICFLPWFFVLLKQVSNVADDYWIPPINWNIYGWCLIAGTILIFIIIRFILKSENRKELFLSAWGISVPATTILVGLVVSELVKPVFILRYVVPALMCMWISFMLFHRSFRPIMRKVFLIAVIASSFVCMAVFAYTERTAQVASGESIEWLTSLDEDSVIIVSCSGHISDTVAAYTEDWVYNWRGAKPVTATQQYSKAFTNRDNFDDIDLLYDLLAQDTDIYYFERIGASDYECIPEDVKLKCEMTYIGDYKFFLDVSVYKISLKEKHLQTVA